MSEVTNNDFYHLIFLRKIIKWMIKEVKDGTKNGKEKKI